MLDITFKPGHLCNHIWDKYISINNIYLICDQRVFGSDGGVVTSLKLTSHIHKGMLEPNIKFKNTKGVFYDAI